MLDIYKTENGVISKLNELESDVWVNLEAPSASEIKQLAINYCIDIDDLRAALDEEESSRVQIEDEYTLILVDVPSIEIRNDREAYTTIPLGIIILENAFITICTERILRPEYFGRIKGFSTKKRMRFVYLIMNRIASMYQSYLRVIDKKRAEIENAINRGAENAYLVDLHELDSNLVYFTTSLTANAAVLERLSKYQSLRQYEEDMELLEDVIIENKQAVEMTHIYRDIIRGTRELLSNVLDNRLNNVMKLLTSITVVMSVPNIISGFYGMNLNIAGIPFGDTPYGFIIICGITVVICAVTLFVLKKKNLI